jgi:hypothetical protein
VKAAQYTSQALAKEMTIGVYCQIIKRKLTALKTKIFQGRS